MQDTSYGIGVTVPLEFQRAVEETTAALKQQGFGILTSIDVQQVFREKLDREFRKYVILGACNPVLAHRAFTADIEVGLLLPCNVIVYEIGPQRTAVSAMAPMVVLNLAADDATLRAVATEADERLRRVMGTLEGS
jgi:uncharacterized protein (DUF302 family)